MLKFTCFFFENEILEILFKLQLTARISITSQSISFIYSECVMSSCPSSNARSTCQCAWPPISPLEPFKPFKSFYSNRCTFRIKVIPIYFITTSSTNERKCAIVCYVAIVVWQSWTRKIIIRKNDYVISFSERITVIDFIGNNPIWVNFYFPWIRSSSIRIIYISSNII